MRELRTSKNAQINFLFLFALAIFAGGLMSGCYWEYGDYEGTPMKLSDDFNEVTISMSGGMAHPQNSSNIQFRFSSVGVDILTEFRGITAELTNAECQVHARLSEPETARLLAILRALSYQTVYRNIRVTDTNVSRLEFTGDEQHVSIHDSYSYSGKEELVLTKRPKDLYQHVLDILTPQMEAVSACPEDWAQLLILSTGN